MKSQSANDICAETSHRLLHRAEGLARVQSEGAESCGALASDCRKSINVANAPRRLTNNESTMNPRADNNQVSCLNGMVIGFLHGVQTRDGPTFLLQIGGDHFGRLPGVAREAFN